MSDLRERLKEGPSASVDYGLHLRKYQALCDEAADEIASLRASEADLFAKLAEATADLDDALKQLASATERGDQYYEQITCLEAQIASARKALERCRIVLGNMALENEGAIFKRWPINHEPLRNDARNLLPVVDAALASALREGKTS